jgi:hypothetical protein
MIIMGYLPIIAVILVPISMMPSYKPCWKFQAQITKSQSRPGMFLESNPILRVNQINYYFLSSSTDEEESIFLV